MSQRNSRSLLLAALILIDGFFAPACFATLINNLTVQNSSQNGGTGDTYQICPGGGPCGTTTGFVGGATQYVDRTCEITPALPPTVNGQMFIMTADSDKNADAGNLNYMSVTLGQAAIVYVVHCTAISPIPTWLTSYFLDTGTSITNNNNFTFELYSQTYAAGSTVVLGSNTVTGTNSSIAMYSVVVVPIPTSLISHLIVDNTAANGGAGKRYQVCPGGNACESTSGFQENALQYLDRTFQINSTVPAGVSGQTFIMTGTRRAQRSVFIQTANGDKSTIREAMISSASK